MPKTYKIRLSDQQRQSLRSLTSKGQVSARKLRRAQILLYAEEGRKTKDIAQLLSVTETTVSNVKRRFVFDGLPRAIEEEPRSGKPPKLTAEVQAYLLALSTSEPPEDSTRWTLHLLAERLIEPKLVDSISHQAVFKVLKKVRSNPG